eukprot:6021982-Prorocentrum_lima.AAC.1
MPKQHDSGQRMPREWPYRTNPESRSFTCAPKHRLAHSATPASTHTRTPELVHASYTHTRTSKTLSRCSSHPVPRQRSSFNPHPAQGTLSSSESDETNVR